MQRTGLLHGPLGTDCLHICVDMQTIFLPASPWGTPWMEQRLPVIEALAEAHAARTVFTRFLPVQDVDGAVGTWKRYYRKWDMMTLARLDPGQVDLVPALARLAPPATVIDKTVYSPWTEGRLDRLLATSSAHTLIVSGGETDVCVLTTVMGAIDRGYRVVVAADGVCGSADETHDAAMTILASRFGEQVELASTEEILAAWR
jgi:nicotinamidase-related amidase